MRISSAARSTLTEQGLAQSHRREATCIAGSLWDTGTLNGTDQSWLQHWSPPCSLCRLGNLYLLEFHFLASLCLIASAASAPAADNICDVRLAAQLFAAQAASYEAKSANGSKLQVVVLC